MTGADLGVVYRSFFYTNTHTPAHTHPHTHTRGAYCTWEIDISQKMCTCILKQTHTHTHTVLWDVLEEKIAILWETRMIFLPSGGRHSAMIPNIWRLGLVIEKSDICPTTYWSFNSTTPAAHVASTTHTARYRPGGWSSLIIWISSKSWIVLSGGNIWRGTRQTAHCHLKCHRPLLSS